MIHGQVVGQAADTSQFEYVPRVDVDWGHLQPGTFRHLFIPRSELKEDDESSVSSFSDSDDSEHREERERKEKAAREFAERTGTDAGNASRGMSLMSRFAQKGRNKAAEIAKKGAEYFDDEAEREKEEKKAKKAAKAKKAEEEDVTPEWAKQAGFKLLLNGVIPLEGCAPDLEVPPAPERMNHAPELIGRVIGFLNPRRIGRAVRLGRAWANVGYQDPLYYCLVQIGVPAVTIYASDRRVERRISLQPPPVEDGERPSRAARRRAQVRPPRRRGPQLRRRGARQGRTRERNSQLQRLISRPFSTRFG